MNNKTKLPTTKKQHVELAGGFTLQEATELLDNLVTSHICKAVSPEKMKFSERINDLEFVKKTLVSAAWFVRAHIEGAEENQQ